jgi:hypothetical protein
MLVSQVRAVIFHLAFKGEESSTKVVSTDWSASLRVPGVTIAKIRSGRFREPGNVLDGMKDSVSVANTDLDEFDQL